jgi:hypothetical protein
MVRLRRRANAAGAMTDVLPRVAHGNGRMPTHVHYIHQDAQGRTRIDINEATGWRSGWGFYRSLECADRDAYDRQMDRLLAARIPFMVGHMIQGPSDDARHWLQEKGRPIDYLEISVGGKKEWSVREIRGEAKEWRGCRLKDLLGPPVDLFA